MIAERLDDRLLSCYLGGCGAGHIHSLILGAIRSIVGFLTGLNGPPGDDEHGPEDPQGDAYRTRGSILDESTRHKANELVAGTSPVYQNLLERERDERAAPL